MPHAEYFFVGLLLPIIPPAYAFSLRIFAVFLLFSKAAAGVFFMLKGRKPRNTGDAAMALAKEVVIKLCGREAFEAIVGLVVAVPASPETCEIYDAHRFLTVATLACFLSALEEAFLEFDLGDLLDCFCFCRAAAAFFVFEVDTAVLWFSLALTRTPRACAFTVLLFSSMACAF